MPASADTHLITITTSKLDLLSRKLSKLGVVTRSPIAKSLTGTLALAAHSGWIAHLDGNGLVSLFHISEGTANARNRYPVIVVDLEKRAWAREAASALHDQIARGFPALGQKRDGIPFPTTPPDASVDIMPPRPWTDDWRTAIYEGAPVPDLVVNSQGIILFAPEHPQAGTEVPHEKVTARRKKNNPEAKPRIHRLRLGGRHSDYNALRIVAETFLGPPPSEKALPQLIQERMWRTASNIQWASKKETRKPVNLSPEQVFHNASLEDVLEPDEIARQVNIHPWLDHIADRVFVTNLGRILSVFGDRVHQHAAFESTTNPDWTTHPAVCLPWRSQKPAYGSRQVKEGTLKGNINVDTIVACHFMDLPEHITQNQMSKKLRTLDGNPANASIHNLELDLTKKTRRPPLDLTKKKRPPISKEQVLGCIRMFGEGEENSGDIARQLGIGVGTRRTLVAPAILGHIRRKGKWGLIHHRDPDFFEARVEAVLNRQANQVPPTPLFKKLVDWLIEDGYLERDSEGLLRRTCS